MGIVLKAGFVTAVAAVFAGSVLLLRGGAAETGGEIRVLSRLDEYTRASNPSIANTIPTFLMQAGRTGILPPPTAPAPDATLAPGAPTATAPPATAPPATAPPAAAPPAAAPPAAAPPAAAALGTGTGTPPGAPAPAPAGGEQPAGPVPEAPIPVSAVRPLDEVELQKGFCTATLSRLVRQQYPGTYDGIPDAQLEKTLLKQRPEYKGRLCILPVWIDADPHDIVKYEVRQDVAAIPQVVWLWSGLIAAGFAVAGIVAYKRLSD
ncbi:MAG: hypothetical protein A3H97_22910 [Acidobacteria bacterium RIFCSPLOWO2_02_FULL_65_29]|nr:MAG: hypothetical protein A3H97_22910 [Acidobacteria bacterium RIFCSPLOWO2_02_FULL_65_29]